MSKIFGIGLSRTGTRTLTKAMRILGYSANHQPKYISRIKNYDFCNDVNVATMYKWLEREYPGSKFILTIRDEETWKRSMAGHAVRIKNWIARSALYGAPQWLEETYVAAFRRHNYEVQEYFKGREDFLILNICAGEGWEKLCPFLDKEMPEEEFPHSNKGYRKEQIE